MSYMKNNGQKFGVIACCTSLVGGMIGSAIFSLSGQTMVQAGPGAVFTWILAGFVMLFYGLLCAELSSRYPVSGGLYLFPAKAFNNNLVGWISNWGSVLANIVAVAFSAIYVAIYLGVGFNLGPHAQVPLALVSILACLVLNVIKNNLFSKVNGVLVGLLIITMLIYICLAFTSGRWSADNLHPFLTQGTLGKTGFIRAIPVAMLGYGNIVSMAFLVSKTKDPNKTIPKSVLISMIFVVGIYTFMVFSTLGLLRVSYLQENPGMSFIPIYAACFTALEKFPWITRVVSVSAVLSLVTTMVILMQVSANGLSASAEDGILPAVFKKKNTNGEPVYGMVVVALICAAIACFPSFTEKLVNFGALFSVVTIILNVLSVLKSRKEGKGTAEEKKSGRFIAPGGVFIPLLLVVIIFLCYLADITSGWEIWVYSAVCYAVGIGIYAIAGKRRKKD